MYPYAFFKILRVGEDNALTPFNIFLIFDGGALLHGIQPRAVDVFGQRWLIRLSLLQASDPAGPVCEKPVHQLQAANINIGRVGKAVLLWHCFESGLFMWIILDF
jgi:hypothetical protein